MDRGGEDVGGVVVEFDFLGERWRGGQFEVSLGGERGWGERRGGWEKREK